MPRADIRMSEPEIDAFLARQDHVVLACLDRDGTTIGTVAAFGYAEGVSVVLARDEDVIDAIAVDDRVCCLAEQSPTYYEIKAVALHGRARREAVSPEGLVTFTVDVAHTVSFDFGKLAAA